MHGSKFVSKFVCVCVCVITTYLSGVNIFSVVFESRVVDKLEINNFVWSSPASSDA